jgi:hypothetical protein
VRSDSTGCEVSYHGRPLARELTEQRMFDWLDEQIST